MQEHPELWSRYFSDFTYHVLKVDITDSPLSGKIVEAMFPDIHTLDPVTRMVYLHVYTMFKQLDLASITVLLRPLETIMQVAEHVPYSLSQSGSSEAKELMSAIWATKHPFGDPLSLRKFLISSLFSALFGSVFPQQQLPEAENVQGELCTCHCEVHIGSFSSIIINITAVSSFDLLRVWYNTYLAVTSMPAFKHHLLSDPLLDIEQAKFNVMHTTFIMVYIHSTCSQKALLRASQVFTAMFKHHFQSNLEVGSTHTQLNTHTHNCHSKFLPFTS